MEKDCRFVFVCFVPQNTNCINSKIKNKSKIIINVPLFKKLRDIIDFLRDNHFFSYFEGLFEGAKTFLTS